MSDYEFDGFQPFSCCGLAECLDAAGIDGQVPAWRMARDLLREATTTVTESCGAATQ